jgi:arylsulfatase A-like enzyme
MLYLSSPMTRVSGPPGVTETPKSERQTWIGLPPRARGLRISSSPYRSVQHGVHDFLTGTADVGPQAKSFMDDETCYTDVLSDHGWTCGLSGKWHLGNSTLPQHGLAHWFAHPHGAGQYNDQEMIRNGVTELAPGYVTTPHSPWTGHPQEIVDSYDDCAFESCPQEEPHPWAIMPRNRDTTSADATTLGLSNNLGNRESLKGYFASVTAMDHDVGRILDKLESLGLRERTLVIFASDNGYSCGHHGFWGKGNGTNPVNMYENSIKVPFIASHPGVIPEGMIQSAMVASYDFMPTLLDYLDLPLPDTQLPGSSFLPALKDENSPGRDTIVVYDEYGYCRMIRTDKWKYVHRYPEGPNELWDLVNDPDERTNLIDDPAQRERISELRTQMESWFEEYVDTDKDGIEFDVGAGQSRPVGIKWDDGTDAFVYTAIKRRANDPK